MEQDTDEGLSHAGERYLISDRDLNILGTALLAWEDREARIPRARDPIGEGLAFEARLGRPPAPWCRALAPFGIFYTARELRVTVALTRDADGTDRACLYVARIRADGPPEADELALARRDFLPANLPVRPRWTALDGERVMLLEAVVPAEASQVHHAA